MKRLHALLCGLLLFLLGHAASGESTPVAFVSFGEFFAGVEAASVDGFMAQSDSTVSRPEDFERLRQYLISTYQGVSPRHSFLLDSQYFDCIPVEQQPSARQLAREQVVLQAPPMAADDAPEGLEPQRPEVRRAPSPLTLGLQDAFGNAIYCAAGTIPMRRITLEELTRFGTLENFFRKEPVGDVAGSPSDPSNRLAFVHRYAHAYQLVQNHGGNSSLNLWSPQVNPSRNQVFSLSQHWYVGGSGKNLQTAEGGWQAFPGKYGTAKSVLFIYWTADGYNKTGCYNLDCPAFVQVAHDWALGAPWGDAFYSTPSGTQFEFRLQWKFTGGNWWLFLQGSGNAEAIGYYPGSQYKGGQLSKYATEVDYGGETVGSGSFPPMGGSAFADQGFGKAAYQRLIYYIDRNDTSQWTKLNRQLTSPTCYTLSLTSSSAGGTWGTYFYFGGPGGFFC